MTTKNDRALDYQKRAQEARLAAARAQNPFVRDGYMKVAEDWERMAKDLQDLDSLLDSERARGKIGTP